MEARWRVGLGQAFGTTGMEQGGIHEGQLGRVQRPNCGAGAQCVPTTQDGGVLVTPPHPTPQCPPFDLRAPPFLPGGRAG